MWSLNEPLEAPSDSHKIRGFCAALEDDDQPPCLYHLLVGGASGDILSDIDDRISSPSGLHSKQVLKLLLYPGIRSRYFCQFEGEEVTKAHSLNRLVTELVGINSFDNLNRTDVILSFSEAEDMEAAMRSIVEATYWTDWWTFAMKSLALKSSSNACLVCCLSLAGTRCQLLVVKTALTLWANFVLKRYNAVLAKVKASLSFESFMDLHNARLSNFTELFPTDIFEKAVERSSKVLHDEAIRKAVAQEKPRHKAKKLHFSQLSHQQQQSKWSCGSSAGKSSFHFGLLVVVILEGFFFFFPSREAEKILKVPCLPHSHR